MWNQLIVEGALELAIGVLFFGVSPGRDHFAGGNSKMGATSATFRMHSA